MGTELDEAERVRWSEVFRRSSLSAVLFNVDKEFRGRVIKAIEDAGLRRVTRSTILGTPVSSGMEAYAATAILDGYVVELLERWGLPAGDALKSGMRVVGTRPMRLLCHLLNLEPPTRRLKVESSAPAVKDLLDELVEQKRQPPSHLDSQAERCIGIRKISELLKLVIDLFGEEAVPDPSDSLLALLPGEAQWGEAKLNRLVQMRLEGEGIDPFDAAEWIEMGFYLSQIIALKECSPQAGREFHDLGYRPYHIVEMLKRSIPVEAPEANIAAGFTIRHHAAEAAINGYTAEEVQAFVSSGMLQLRGFRDILRAGLSVDSAKEWLDLGFAPDAIERLVRGGWTPHGAAEALADVPKEQWSLASRDLSRSSD